MESVETEKSSEVLNETNSTTILEQLRLIFDQIKVAKNFVDDGKEVKCSQQLQGAKTRCLHLIEKLSTE